MPPHLLWLAGIPSIGRNIKKKKPKVFTYASWNVRTLLDNTKVDRPERRTVLVARELARYNVDITALSETHFADKGQMTETGGGYTFFWSGRSSEERREVGVDFANKSIHVRILPNITKGINDRLMTMQIPLGKKVKATIVSAYAPNMTNSDEIKDKFYEELDPLIISVKSKKLIILGDFNASVGADHHAWHRILGKHGIGKCNSNGHLLLRTCAPHDLAITNTKFHLPTWNKTSWMHPRSKHWHRIDYVIVRARDLRDVKVTKAMCGTKCWTGHRPIISRMNFHIQPKKRPQGQKVKKKLNVTALKNTEKEHCFQTLLQNKFSSFQINQSSIEDQWASFRDTAYSAALESLGPATRYHHDWFDENNAEIQKLLEEKHHLHRAHQNDASCTAKKAAFTKICSKVQTELRHMQDSWLSGKADEIQGYADSADSNTLLTEKKFILEILAEHFHNVLNRPAQINDEAIARLPQVPTNNDFDDLLSADEVRQAINQMSTGRAPGSDAIPAKVHKSGEPVIVSQLTILYQSMWNKEQLPQEFRDATIVHIYKRKGNSQSCDSHRGISLLSIAGKILACVPLKRLLEHLEISGFLPESQCGFRADRGTIDMIFASRQLQEKCIEQYRDLYTAFVDLTKAFNTVSRAGLWGTMAKFGCPRKFIAFVRQFHDGVICNLKPSQLPTDSNRVVSLPRLFSA
ncbi:uncharacterized protein LOC143018749 [Oratosquilla oratoria]|uniref:uncharacterized protein LOC143018749 n=1 Tax=Oratosquilla oratoria TaxID=337810 RepID=UPI003F768E56